MQICEKMKSYVDREQYLELDLQEAKMRLWFLTDEIIRVRVSFDNDFNEASYSLMMTCWDDKLDSFFGSRRKHVQPSCYRVEDLGNMLLLHGKKLRVEITYNPFGIQIYDLEGNLLHEDISGIAYQKDRHSRVIHTSRICKGDHFYGFGEKTGHLDKYEECMNMAPADSMGYNPEKTDSLYKHIPFYIKLNENSKRACGYFYHTTSECEFNMGQKKSNYWKEHSIFRGDCKDIDLFFIMGPGIKDVITNYTLLTGRPTLLPKTALGYLGSSMYYAELDKDCDDAIVHFIETAKKENIPIDGFHLSSGYTTQQNNKRCVFTWNKDRFKDPKDFFAKMKELGIVVTPNVKPGILLEHPMMIQFLEDKIFVLDEEKTNPQKGSWWGGVGYFTDFTNPKTREHWKKYLKENLISYGVQSVWNDNCEYDSIVDEDAYCDYEGQGGKIGDLRAVMANIMCKVTEEALLESNPEERPYIVCRAGHSGIGQYAQTWAGDNYTSWETLRYNIPTILGMGLSGTPNEGCDIGGFYGPAPEPELFVRWVQSGIFQPRFSIHSTNTDNTVTQPWMYREYLPFIRNAIGFRYRMMPYLYSLMYRAHVTGLPIMQPLVSVFQEDTNCYTIDNEFMLGEALLVAPVIEKNASKREIYLPKGEIFYNFYNYQRYEGGQSIVYDVTIDSIPMFLRAGSIFVLSGEQLMNLSNDDMKTALFYLSEDRDSEFELYEDDGKTNHYKNGEYRRTIIHMETGEKLLITLRKEGRYESTIENLCFNIISTKRSPLYVSLNGKVIKHYLEEPEYQQVTEGWYYDATHKVSRIKFAKPEEDTSLIVSFEPFDLIRM